MSKSDPKKVYISNGETEVINNFELFNHLRDNRKVNKSDLLVALCLASRRNSVSARCFPGKNTIMKDTGLSRTGVRKSIRNLENLGVIIVVNEGDKYTDNEKHDGRTSNSYFFVYDLEYQYHLMEQENHPMNKMEYETGLFESALLKFKHGVTQLPR